MPAANVKPYVLRYHFPVTRRRRDKPFAGASSLSAGFEWNEYLPYTDANNSEMQMLRAADRWRFALAPALVAPPGQQWSYNGGCTERLGAVVSRATNRPLEQYAREVLFAPLGTSEVEW
jgi:CubicO group peptidase (beta-lactamase class C family)